MSLLAAVLLVVLAWIVFKSLTAVVLVLALVALVLFIAGNGSRRL